jgi:hypothetical protein
MKHDQLRTTTAALVRTFPLSPTRILWILLGSTLLFLTTRLNGQTAQLPSTFEPNQGQAPDNVKWLGRSGNYLLLFEEEGLTFVLPDKTSKPTPEKGRLQPIHYNLIHMSLPGARWKNMAGVEPTGGVSNYVSPGEGKARIANVPLYQQVRVSSVYDGIDLVFHTDGNHLEYDFVLAPGADPARIQLAFTGTRAIDVDPASGDLVLTALDGSQLRQHRPNVFQQSAAHRVSIAASYRTLGPSQATFALAPYDHTRALTIDPTVDFTTFYGGSSYDTPTAIAVDSQGDTYIAGCTGSMNFPVTNGSKFDKPKNFDLFGFTAIGPNIFVAKLDPTGKVVFATYGGVGNAHAMTADSSGVYITGIVYPPDGDNVIGFTDNSDGDYFVWRLDSQLGLKDYYQVLGGLGTDEGNAIGVDSAHDAWVTGSTYVGKSFNNPVSGQVFVTELAPDGRSKNYLTFGSDKEDIGYGLAVGPETNDRPWITGKTCGNGFPTTDSVIHHQSHCGVFLLVLEPTGIQDVGMVFGGADGDDIGYKIVPNGAFDAYITGSVTSSNFPTTQGAFATTKNPGPQAFVTQIDATNGPGNIVHSTLFQADGVTTPYGIAEAVGKGLYISGSTTSGHLPGGPVLAPNPSAGFVTKFTFDLSRVLYTQLLGLSVSDLQVINQHGAAPAIYTTGYRYTGTHTDDHIDAFVVKLEEGTPSSSVTNLPEEEDDPTFNISWSGTDAASPIASYDIYFSDNGGPFSALEAATPATSVSFQGTLGHTYGFFSVATDTAGNKEPMKTEPDTVVRVGPPPPIHITCANCSFDIDGVKAAIAFDVTTPSNSGSFTFNNQNSANPIKFASTEITKVSVVGNFATIYGNGTLNGKSGYTYTLSATDAGGPGSNMDTVLVQLFGPDNFTYNAPSILSGGDVAVQQ